MTASAVPSAPRRSGDVPRMRDICGTLRDGWYVACTANALDKRPPSRTIMEDDLVLWRGPDGAPNCLLDRCLHRNARLSEGTVESGLVVCPYHVWHYDRGGACVKVPSEGPCSAGLPGRRVPSFPVREASGLIWVWMGDAEDPKGEPFAIPFRQDDGWISYYMVTPFQADVTDCVENFMDVPHTIYTHAGWFRSKSAKKVAATVERRESEVLVTYDHSSDVIGFTHLLVNPNKEPVVHTDHFFMPNVTGVDYHFGSSRSLEGRLRENPHYAWCRDLGQLGPCVVLSVKDGAAKYEARSLAEGRRAGDLKPMPLVNTTNWRPWLLGELVGSRGAS